MKPCPKCKTDLTLKKIGPVQADECKTCKGIWFDQDELRRSKDTTDPDLNWMDFEIWKHGADFKAKPSQIACPNCKTATAAIDYANTNAEIDYCPVCEGIWLDAGEFEKIIRSLEQELTKKSFNDYVKASLTEAKEILTGPESLMSEWKDFATVLRLMHYRMFVENPKLLYTVVTAQKINPLK